MTSREANPNNSRCQTRVRYYKLTKNLIAVGCSQCAQAHWKDSSVSKWL